MTATLSEDVVEATVALSAFDSARLEALEEKIRSVTAEHLLLSLAHGEEMLSGLLLKHSLLGQMVEITAANLKVLASVLQVTNGTATF